MFLEITDSVRLHAVPNTAYISLLSVNVSFTGQPHTQSGMSLLGFQKTLRVLSFKCFRVLG